MSAAAEPAPVACGATVDDYEALLDRALGEVSTGDIQGRSDVYGRARRALEATMRATDVAVPEADIAAQVSALDLAIARVEARCAAAAAPVEDEALPSPGSGHGRFALNAAASGAVSLLKVVVQLFMVPVMARLLGPTAYGIYAIALPTVVFFVLLADGGIGASLAREDESHDVLWSTAFWVLLGTCSAMALVVAGSGFVLAWTSGQPSLIGIMALLSLSLPLLAVLVPADARLIRRGNLLYHSAADTGATLVGAAVALALAYAGAGAWSLAFQFVVAFAIRAAVLNFVAWSRPSLVFDLSSLRGHLSTSGATLASRVSELLGKVAENTLFGHIFGPVVLGSYTFSNQLSRFACEAVTNPLIGAFYAHVLHASDEAASQMLARLSRLSMMVLLPATAVMVAVAPSAFPIVLGAKWVDAAPLFRGMLIPYALLSVSWLGGQVLLKHGLVERSARVQVAAAVLRISVVAVGFATSPLVVAYLIGASYVIQAIGLVLAVPARLRQNLPSLAADLCPLALAAAVAASVSAVALGRLPHDMVGLALSSAAGGAVYLAALLAFGGSTARADLAGAWRILRHRSLAA